MQRAVVTGATTARHGGYSPSRRWTAGRNTDWTAGRNTASHAANDSISITSFVRGGFRLSGTLRDQRSEAVDTPPPAYRGPFSEQASGMKACEARPGLPTAPRATRNAEQPDAEQAHRRGFRHVGRRRAEREVVEQEVVGQALRAHAEASDSGV